MCVICIKPKGVLMPPQVWLENMWYSNSDGAGFMWADGKKVHIKKGYMDFDDFMDAIEMLGDEKKLKDIPLVMHFRIGTAGGNVPANTHPFPISDSIPVLQKLVCTAKIGVVHNGIIPIKPRQENISDTMEYIASTLAPLCRYDNEFYKSKDLLQMIGNQTSSKLAFMNAKGEIYTVGSFTEDAGCMFSNTSYLSGYWYRRVPTRYVYDYEYDDYMDEYSIGQEFIDDLMMLESGSYVIDMDTGDFFDADDYCIFMDSAGFLYAYDDTAQACYPLDETYEPFNMHGNTIHFDKEKAAAMLIMDTNPIKLPHEIEADTEEKKEATDPDNPF